MNWEAIGAIGETIGAIAVVLTLVYLSIQIRQNTRSVRAATYQSVAEALADCSYKLVGHMEDEASDRRLLFIGTIRRYENLYFQMRQGNIGESDAEAFFNSLSVFLIDSRFSGYWDIFRPILDPSFAKYVDDQVLTTSSDLAREIGSAIDKRDRDN